MKDTRRKIPIVGGAHDGKHIEWFGNRVAINGTTYALHVHHMNGAPSREYYVAEGAQPQFEHVEVCK